MKKLISLLLATIIIAFVVFAINYWILGFDITESKVFGITAGATGLIIEYLHPFIAQLSKRFDITNKKLTKR
jgi:putative exporter of polyketide antibiotics